ncbi:MAG TPA: nucleotidyltransferase [Fimbriimonadaceae bacterium]|nr:nucleotidyltransferase [Fimbriimonadaceae bacterium]
MRPVAYRQVNSMASTSTGREPDIDWSDLIPEQEWEVQKPIIERAQALDLPFALGGGLAFSEYARRLRNTKDLDLFINPRDGDAFLRILDELGWEDYHSTKEYERHWIYRGTKRGLIIDIIWRMPNERADIDDEWLTRGKLVRIHGTELRLLPVEELIWSKLYVVQRDRSDWSDLLNLVHTQGEHLDWDYLLDRVQEDRLLLGGLLNIYRWMCQGDAMKLPPHIWERMGLMQMPLAGECRLDRVRLLDTRDWFGPNT